MNTSKITSVGDPFSRHISQYMYVCYTYTNICRGVHMQTYIQLQRNKTHALFTLRRFLLKFLYLFSFSFNLLLFVCFYDISFHWGSIGVYEWMRVICFTNILFFACKYLRYTSLVMLSTKSAEDPGWLSVCSS